MHWEIGKLLYERKLDSKHGDSVVKRLSGDLKVAYPKMGMRLQIFGIWSGIMYDFVNLLQNSDSVSEFCLGGILIS